MMRLIVFMSDIDCDSVLMRIGKNELSLWLRL